jgi:hypothetical protein
MRGRLRGIRRLQKRRHEDAVDVREKIRGRKKCEKRISGRPARCRSAGHAGMFYSFSAATQAAAQAALTTKQIQGWNRL